MRIDSSRLDPELVHVRFREHDRAGRAEPPHELRIARSRGSEELRAVCRRHPGDGPRPDLPSCLGGGPRLAAPVADFSFVGRNHSFDHGPTSPGAARDEHLLIDSWCRRYHVGRLRQSLHQEPPLADSVALDAEQVRLLQTSYFERMSSALAAVPPPSPAPERPRIPDRLEDLGIPRSLVSDLVLRYLWIHGSATLGSLNEALSEIIDALITEHQAELLAAEGN